VVRLAVLTACGVVALAVVASAFAIDPTITGVGSKNRHPVVTFNAPKSNFVVIEIATKPDRASNGDFLSENSKVFDVLTDSEVQGGAWLYAYQLDPGSYWVLLHASPDFNLCYQVNTGEYDPSCANGFAGPVQLTIPRPVSRYRGDVTPRLFFRQVQLRFVVTPLGDRLPYQVCYPTASRRQRCLSGAVQGFSWNSSASDVKTVNAP
jgi:hypothetical protein